MSLIKARGWCPCSLTAFSCAPQAQGCPPSPAVELLGAEGVEDIQCVPCQEGQNPQDNQDRSLLLHTK